MKSVRRSLEGYKIFPYIAWGILFLFVLIVYNMVMELRAATENLRTSTEILQAQVKSDPRFINLEQY